MTLKTPEPNGPAMLDNFDRLIGSLEGLPDVTKTKPSTIRTTQPLIGSSEMFIVTTFRQRDRGDTIFIECIKAEGSFRLAIPPRVAETIARQREALTDKVRSKSARAVAAERKARGEPPAFVAKRRSEK